MEKELNKDKVTKIDFLIRDNGLGRIDELEQNLYEVNLSGKVIKTRFRLNKTKLISKEEYYIEERLINKIINSLKKYFELNGKGFFKGYVLDGRSYDLNIYYTNNIIDKINGDVAEEDYIYSVIKEVIDDKNIKSINIDKDKIDFFNSIYFNLKYDNYIAASKRAYLDLNRTIRFNKMENEKRIKLKNNVDLILREEIKKMLVIDINTQKDYDNWHENVCNKIAKVYLDKGIKFYLGQAQKWLNMTIKYLYILGECDFNDIFEYLHVPLDNYIYKFCEKNLNIKIPNTSWSRIDSYEYYISYQNKIRNKVNEYPLKWEFKSWIEELKKQK